MASIHRKARMAVALAVVLALPAAVHAETAGRWVATSKTAIAITGDIDVTDDALTFENGTVLPLVRVEERQGRWSPVADMASGTIYRLVSPADPVLLNGNSLCGMPTPVTYIVLSQSSPASLSLTVYTGAEPNGFSEDACAAYFYER